MQNLLIKLPLSFKLVLPSLALSALIGFIGYISFQRLSIVVNDYQVISDDVLPTTRGAEELYTDFQAVRIGLRTLGLPNVSVEEQQKAIKSVNEAITLYEKTALKLQDPKRLSTEEKKIWEEVNANWLSFKAVGARVLELQAKRDEEGNLEKMREIFYTDCPKAADAYKKSITSLINFLDIKADKYSYSANSLASEAKKIILWTGVLGILIGFLLTMFAVSSAKNLVRKINKIAKVLSAKAANVEKIASEIDDCGTTLLQSSTEQAAAIQETTASIEETSAMIAKNAENSKNSAVISKTSKELCSNGLDSMGNVMNSMDDLNRISEEIEKSIEQSNKELEGILSVIANIGTKTNVINEIVFQTKLLSFNASVEAARAGEQGKGFAVVAEEVGNLAQMSGKSADEIRALLEESAAKVGAVVGNTKERMNKIIRETKEKVVTGTKNTQECSLMLKKVDDSVTEVSHLIEEISVASVEQSHGVKEISSAISSLDLAAQSNQNVASKSFTYVAELKNESDEFVKIIRELSSLVGKEDSADESVASKSYSTQSRIKNAA